jgi:hypothetical protein
LNKADSEQVTTAVLRYDHAYDITAVLNLLTLSRTQVTAEAIKVHDGRKRKRKKQYTYATHRSSR